MQCQVTLLGRVAHAENCANGVIVCGRGYAELERETFENRLKSCIEEHLALLDMRKSERAQKDGNVLQLRRRSGSEVG